MGNNSSTDRTAFVAETNFHMEVHNQPGSKPIDIHSNAIFDGDKIISNHSGRYWGIEYEGIIFGEHLQLIKNDNYKECVQGVVTSYTLAVDAIMSN